MYVFVDDWCNLSLKENSKPFNTFLYSAKPDLKSILQIKIWLLLTDI